MKIDMWQPRKEKEKKEIRGQIKIKAPQNGGRVLLARLQPMLEA